MKNYLLLFLLPVFAFGQVKPKEIEEIEREFKLEKPSGITDRAGGTHNASNIGLFFENRGKLYPRRIAQGPSGEFPINSGKQYIYRINPMIGIPGNVIQGRYTTNEEWEAVGGYQAEGSAKIAFSDDPKTWPASGWPVKDANGNPIFVSDQDSYCVYDDANNQLGKLGIQIHQIGYAYGLKSIQNCIFYTFKIISTRNTALSNVYFGIYADIDVGNVSGGDPEYADDKLGFDKTKNFVYFYDDGVTSEWPDGKTGYFGMALFQTPKVNGVELGLTDMHYNLYNDDKDQDTIQYGIMSSAASLYNSVDGNKYFHLGTNPNLHYDDPKTIPPAGMDLVANFGSGPYTLNPNDTLTFVMAILAGNDSADIYKTYNETKKVFLNNYEAAKPPLTPTLTGAAGNNRVTLFWDDKAEKSKDSYSGQYDFEGYRLYRSVDKGIHWKLLSEYDIINNIGLDKGLQYSYTDSTVINGIEYWYTLTSFDRGDSGVASLECGLGKVPGVPNLAVVIPHSEAIGRTPVSLDSVYHIGNGKSNYLFNVKPADLPINTANTYEVGFTYTTRYERGAPSVKAEIIVGDSAKINKNYSFQFIAPNRVNLINATTGLEFDGNPKSYSPSLGTTYTVQGISDGNFKIKLSPADTVLANRPKAGDIISVNFSVQVKRFGMDTSIVVAPRDFSSLPNFLQATYDGIIFSVKPPEVIQNIYRQGRKDNLLVTFSVGRSDSLKTMQYKLTTIGKGSNSSGAPFIAVLVTRMKDNVNILQADTIYAESSINFDGIEAAFNFPTDDVPQSGNIFYVNSVVPVPPTLADKYRFVLKGASVNNAVIKENLSTIKVVPNPYIVSSLFEPEFGELRREPIRQIQFTNLPPECTIYIFTVDANLVKTLHHNSSSGTEPWDLKSEGGREIASGVYMVLVKTKTDQYMNRFAVIK